MQSDLPATTIQYSAPTLAKPAIDLRKRRRLGESAIQIFLAACGLISVLTTVGIIFVLGREALLFFRTPEVSIVDFVSKVKWQPAIGEFGIWPLVFATVVTSLLAMVVALPVGLMIAIY